MSVLVGAQHAAPLQRQLQQMPVVSLLLVTFHDSGRYSATACISKCSAYRREMGVHCAKRNASAANSACRWWRQIMFIFFVPRTLCTTPPLHPFAPTPSF